jgi:hypothetical protein
MVKQAPAWIAYRMPPAVLRGTMLDEDKVDDDCCITDFLKSSMHSSNAMP